MKKIFEILLHESLEQIKKAELIAADIQVLVQVERTNDIKNGHFATNLAMILAKPCRKSPKQLAEWLVKHLPQTDVLEKVEIAGSGFINFFVKRTALFSIIADVLKQ